MEKIKWEISSFEGLDVASLYKIMRLRSEVFVVEQNAVYLDLDNKDQIALHLQGYIGEELVAYCRLFKAGDYFDEASIGRVIVSPAHQGKGYGHALMDKAVELVNTLLSEDIITISAQQHLKEFYEAHGFIQTSDTYLEDGIPHIRMQRRKE